MNLELTMATEKARTLWIDAPGSSRTLLHSWDDVWVSRGDCLPFPVR